MIPSLPRDSVSQPDTAHLGSPPVNWEDPGGGRDGKLPSYKGLRGKPSPSVQNIEIREASPIEKQTPCKAKAAKGKTPERFRKKVNGTDSSKKKPFPNL